MGGDQLTKALDLRLTCLYCGGDGRQVVTVDALHVPAERREPVAEVSEGLVARLFNVFGARA